MHTIERLAGLVARLANRRVLVISGAIAFALAAVLFASTGPGSLAAVADRCGAPAPDVRFTTSPDAVADFLIGCGDAGRSAYRDLQLVDLVYPAAIGVFLASVLALLLPRAWPGASAKLAALAAVPLVGSFFDYLENAAAWMLLTRFPQPAPAVARVLGSASAAKQLSTWAAVLLLLAAVGGALVQRWRRRASLAPRPLGRG